MSEDSLKIGQLAERSSDAWQGHFVNLPDRRRFGVEDLPTWITARGLRDNSLSVRCEALDNAWVERLACAPSQRGDHIASPETQELGGLSRHASDARGSSDLLGAQATRTAAVPRLVNVVQTEANAIREPDAPRNASRNVATRLIVSLPEPTARHDHAHSCSQARRRREPARRPWNQRGKDVAHVREIRLHGRPPDSVVISKQIERLLGIGHASNMEQQTHVEDISNLAFRQIHASRQGHADETRPQCRFDRQAIAEISNDRKTAEKICEPKPVVHRSIFTCSTGG
jgi:hypothetical protein